MGYKLYSWIFGCNLEEMKNPDLYAYPNLSAFFYRELKEGVRPLADAPLVSPSDGKVLHFGVVQGQEIEQIKAVPKGRGKTGNLGYFDRLRIPIIENTAQ